jgi:tRNA U55 pseudouridine synthase TruB
MINQIQEDNLGNKIRSLSLPSFGLDISSGGGFYVRSLISDLARSVGGRAHMTDLMRVKQVLFFQNIYINIYIYIYIYMYIYIYIILFACFL